MTTTKKARPSLFAILANLDALNAWLRENPEALEDGALPDAVAAELDALEGSLADKLDATMAAARQLKVDAKALDATAKAYRDEAAAYAAKAKAKANRAALLEARVAEAMRAHGIAKQDSGPVTFWLQTVTTYTPTVDADALPDEFVRVTREPNLRAAESYHKTTGELPPGFDRIERQDLRSR